MRKYRMGLIQTPDQLRFSYMAVLEGAKHIRGDSPQVPGGGGVTWPGASPGIGVRYGRRRARVSQRKRWEISENDSGLKNVLRGPYLWGWCDFYPNELAPVSSQNTLVPSGNRNTELPDLFWRLESLIWPSWCSIDFICHWNTLRRIIHDFFVFFLWQNRWQETSKEKQEAASEPAAPTRSAARHPPAEQCNGSQQDSQEGGEYRQDGKAAPQPPCREQELDGGATQSVEPPIFASPSPPPPEPEPVSSASISPPVFAVNAAERTAWPRRARRKQPKANTAPTTRRGRGKGSLLRRVASRGSPLL